MKLRARWFGLSPDDIAIRALADQMQQRQYGRRRAVGFQVEEVRKKYIRGTFIERIEWDDTIEDPARGAFEMHRVEVRRFGFRVSSEVPHIEVIDPPRALGVFVSNISECLGCDVRLSELAVSPADWVRQIEAESGKVIVNAITTRGVPISATAMATIALSGTEDVRKFLKRFTDGARAPAERMSISYPAPSKWRVELLVGGRATVFDGDSETVQALRECLARAQSATG